MRAVVPGLCTFMENSPRSMTREVNLVELAMEYKKDTGKDPVMLVDLSNSITKIGDLGWMSAYCGQLKKFKKNFEKLINNCYEFKIKLIFFGLGISHYEDVENWTKECIRKKANSPSTLTRLHRGTLFHVATCILKSSDKCDFIRSKCENDILNYAKTHGCFAIFAYGSPYVLAEGARYCLSSRHFDIDNMTTYNYDRKKLANALKIKPSRLPVFGAVSACQTITYNNKAGFLRLAKLFKQNFNSYGSGKFSEIFKLNDEEFNNHLEYFSGSKKREKKVLMPVSGNWDRILRLAEERHISGVADREILQCLLYHMFFTNAKMEHKSLTPGAELLPLRTRIYEILFYEYPEEIFIKDHFFPYDLTQPEVKEISVSKSAHCGLQNLWSEDYSRDEKITLFCRTFSSKLTPQDLNKIDIKEELLFPFLTVFYLLNEVGKEFTEYQLKTMVIQSILANELAEEDEASCELWDDTEAFQLSDWFLTTVEHIMLLNSVCGHPFCMYKTNMVNYYDGKLFYDVYHTIKNKNFEKDEDLMGPSAYATYKNFLGGLEQLKKACGHIS